MKISSDPNSVIVTHALGSCIGMVLYDPIAKIGAMLHIMLPLSNSNKDRAAENPFTYADTGIPLTFKSMFKEGGIRNRIIVKVAGGAQVLDKSDFFAIGKRNYLVTKKILWKNQILIKKEDVGGTNYRTLFLDISNGNTWIKYKDEVKEL